MSALSIEKVESLAPDQASLDAARKLLKPATWPALAADGAGLVWGECQGSGSTPYRVVVSELDAGYKCTCPSRKFPCKHSLGLMWLRAAGKVAFASGTAPEWVKDWQSRRRGPGAPEEKEGKPKASIQATEAAEQAANPVADPAAEAKAEARAAAARERNRLDREASIQGGLEELDVWLSDQLERGLAGFAAHAAQSCRTMAQRLVDAKASGLASRLESLPGRLFTLPEPMRPAAAVQELGVLHLLAEAYRRQDALTPALKADVRQAIGWSMTRDALLSDETAVRASGNWRVFAALSEVQPDRLRRMETWLCNEDPASPQRYAVLIDFVPVATGAATSGYGVGDRFEAELVFYPSACPLRAQIASGQSGAQASSEPLLAPVRGLVQAYKDYDRAMAAQPWLGTFPLHFQAGTVRRSGGQLFIAESGGIALPLQPAQATLARPLLQVAPFDGIGLWDGYYFTLCWAQTELGRWGSA
jgi:hypothetical protein